ncbi:Pentatricopeptide repeat-containing protein [Camellia lanceoleosa]|uniref:Pentatricopeptide repeat-containing protein n=1 Tax=Camellia lanceoleosa TaxID=1840588 RepID=A0ACC0H7W8_9ERIC|nr:Pentatricopeptide repeat-containing protein [Camellia lanceoleosa]
MGMATTSFPYNMMISLYSKIGEHSKIHVLIQEMENLGIPLDMFTLKTQISAYAMASDISRMEKILNHIEEDPHCIADWEVYSVAANGYLKVGLIEKALTVLKKMEGTMPLGRKLAFQHLVSLYSSTGLGARKGLFDKAELAISKAIEGRRPFASSWIILAVGYMQNKQMDKAVEMLKKALLVGRMRGWRPNSNTLDAFLEYLEGQGDVEVMEEIIMLLKDSGALTKDSYNRLLRTSVATGRSISSGVLDQMKMKGFTTDEVTQ